MLEFLRNFILVFSLAAIPCCIYMFWHSQRVLTATLLYNDKIHALNLDLIHAHQYGELLPYDMGPDYNEVFFNLGNPWKYPGLLFVDATIAKKRSAYLQDDKLDS